MAPLNSYDGSSGSSPQRPEHYNEAKEYQEQVHISGGGNWEDEGNHLHR